MSDRTKLSALSASGNPCLCCPPIPAIAPLRKMIAVGFGDAVVTRDGEEVFDGEAAYRRGKPVTFYKAERMAKRDPDHDWRVVLYGPLHGETYQRHAAKTWVLVENNMGFA